MTELAGPPDLPTAQRPSHAMSDLPPSPPPEVLDEVAAAWERARVLVLAGFTLDLRTARWSRRLRAQLRGPGEASGRRLTPSDVLALACGDAPTVR
jgi:hypothetical protein